MRLVLASLLLTRIAVAQTTPETLMDEGHALIANGNFDAACAKFTASMKLAPRLATQLAIADCHEREGKVATASTDYRIATTLAERANDEKARDAALAKSKELAAEIPHLVLVIAADEPAGFAVTSDGVELPAASLENPIAIDPGEHVIAATATGAAPWQEKVTVAPKETRPVKIPQLEQELAPPPPRPPREAHGRGREIGAIVAGGVGLVAGAIGAGYMVQAYSDKSEAERSPDCDGASCYVGSRGAKLRDSAHDESVVGGVLLGVAGGAVAVAVVLELTAPRSAQAARETAIRITPAIGPGFAGLSLGRGF
jgi:hypothetical protein